MRWLILIAIAAFLAVFLVLPVATVLGAGLHPGFLAEAVLHPAYRAGLGNSLAIAAVTTALALVLALPAAWICARCRFPGQGLAEALLLGPLVLPPFVGAIGIQQVFGQYGALNALLGCAGQGPDWLGEHRFAAVCTLEALGLYPFLYLTLAENLGRLDPALVEAARAHGAGPFTAFRRVVVPVLRPGLFAGATVVFVWAFTELGTPLMLGYDRCLPVQVYNGLNEIERSRVPYALVVEMLTVSATLYLIARLVFARRAEAMLGKGAHAPSPRRLAGRAAVGAWLLLAGIAALACLPHLAVLATAFSRDWYGTVLPAGATLDHARAALAQEDVLPGIRNSLIYAGGATALGLAVGFAVAWITVRWRPPLWRALDVLAMLPLAVPGVIIAFGYLAIATQIGWLRAWLDPLRNPTLLLIIAYAVRRLPHVVRAVSSGLAQSPPALEEAAAVLGAGPLTRLRRITLPLIAGALCAGALLTFSASMLEVADSLILAQKREFWPITKVIYGLVDILGTGPAVACAFAVWCMLFLAASLAAASALLGRSVTAVVRGG